MRMVAMVTIILGGADAFVPMPTSACVKPTGRQACAPAMMANGRKRGLLGRILFGSEDEQGLIRVGSSKKLNMEWEGAKDPVTKYMQTNIITLSPDTSLSDAGKVLTESTITGAPVVDQDGALVGVLSRHDLLYKIAGVGSFKGVREGGARSERYMENTRRLRKLEAETVGCAMTPFPVHLNPEATMQEATALMLRLNLNRVLITEPESEKLVGIISSTDVFRLAFGEKAREWREKNKGDAAGL